MNDPAPLPLGDMTPDEFRRHAHETVEWIADYLERIREFPVLSRVGPGEVKAATDRGPPLHPVEMETILRDFREDVLPGITHWNHPGFLAYFGISAAAPGILAEMLTAALDVNAMLWRTSPAATELEEVATSWLRDLAGLPDTFRGRIQDTASTSTMVAVGAAREATGLDVRVEGLAGRDLPALRLYCSEEAHSSVERAAITLGIGRAGTRRIPTDGEFRLRPDLLEKAIEEDVRAGYRPFCVVATIGTTSTTSVDPVPRIAEICRRHGLWLHVDAAYAGAAAIVPEFRHHFEGWELADSIVVNPHKWLFVPIDCSVLLLRDPDAVRRAFTLTPEYLTTPESGAVTNLMEYGPALGRRFRSLKLWMTLRYFGREGLTTRIREHVRLAALFRERVESSPGWRVAAPSPFSTVAFRYEPDGWEGGYLDALNEGILERVNRTGRVFLSHTRLRDRFTLRLAIGNIGTDESDVLGAWELLEQAGLEMRGEPPA
jgi:aromatic-L-amino-acid/L-tryptophan decarboxylase